MAGPGPAALLARQASLPCWDCRQREQHRSGDQRREQQALIDFSGGGGLKFGNCTLTLGTGSTYVLVYKCPDLVGGR
jgi:hypothetical protein